MKDLYGSLCLLIALLIIITGCSTQAVNPIAPDEPGKSANIGTHYTWGLWQFSADLNAQTLDVANLRTGNFHLNALPFLEPPALVNLTLESLKFTGNIIDADIGLRHPFLGLTEFTGFDVCGILITNGSVTGFTDPTLRMTGPGDTRLLNPDGYTRWWNPAEFPHGTTIFDYQEGLLGTPDSIADYNSTLNAYKYFCDDLGPNDALDKVTLAKRGMFSAGQKNIRHYEIDMGTGLVFNYAVDACWVFPSGSKPWTAPDDFAEGANRPEAWRADVTEVKNTLWNNGSASGGELSLSIDVWDHYNAGLNKVIVESPGHFTPVSSFTPIGGGAGYSTYQLDIPSATPPVGSMDILIEVECEAAGYQDVLPGKTITAYFLHTAQVSGVGFFLTSPNGGEVWSGLSHQNITWVSPGSITHVDIYYSKDDFTSDINLIIKDYGNTGIYDWYVPNDPSTTVKVKVVESGGPLEDASDNYFTIVKGACIIYVDDDNTTPPFLGTLQDPYQYVQDGVDNAPNDCTVWIKPGVYYEDPGGGTDSPLSEVTITDKQNLILHGEGMPIIIEHRFYGPPWPSGIKATNCPGLVIEGIELNLSYHNEAYIRLTNCADAIVRDCVGHPYVSDPSGGAHAFVNAQNCPGLVVRNNTYIDTTNSSTSSNHLGYISACNNAVITLNKATNNANATNIYQTFAAWLSCYNSTNVEISKNIIGHHNKMAAAQYYQELRGIRISGGSGVIIRNNLIYDLSFHNLTLTAESRNWAVHIANCPNAEVYNNTIDDFGPNYASGVGYTYAIKIEGSTTLAQFHSNIISNIYANGGSSCYGVYSDGVVTQTYSDVWNLIGLTTQRYGGAAVEGTGGKNLNPLYVNPTAFDYHLQSGSPCKGAGLGGTDMGCYGGADPLP